MNTAHSFVKRMGKPGLIASGTALILLIFLGYGIYKYRNLFLTYESAKETFASTTAAFESKVASLEQELSLALSENTRLGGALEEEVGKNELLSGQLENAASTVSTLQKLTTLDSELLQKYSKVFFLSENYEPETLTDITSWEFTYKNGKTFKINTSVRPFLERMVQAARAEGIELRILSAYRSFGEQSSLKASYKVVYGTGANQFSADQGYSEHQLGTTVDFTTPSLGTSIDTFESVVAYSWLRFNAHKYGFTLSYPKGNAFYQFEPWHWRFVGVKLATRLFEDNEHFYDLDQRVIDQYLITIFD